MHRTGPTPTRLKRSSDRTRHHYRHPGGDHLENLPFSGSLQTVGTEVKLIQVDVISLDWKWLFVYPNWARLGQRAGIPGQHPGQFPVTSDTVMNSFFIPQLGGQIYAMAGMQTKLHLIANEAGQYKGISVATAAPVSQA